MADAAEHAGLQPAWEAIVTPASVLQPPAARWPAGGVPIRAAITLFRIVAAAMSSRSGFLLVSFFGLAVISVRCPPAGAVVIAATSPFDRHIDEGIGLAELPVIALITLALISAATPAIPQHPSVLPDRVAVLFFAVVVTLVASIGVEGIAPVRWAGEVGMWVLILFIYMTARSMRRGRSWFLRLLAWRHSASL